MSDRLHAPYTIRKTAENAFAFIDALGIKKEHVIGISPWGCALQLKSQISAAARFV